MTLSQRIHAWRERKEREREIARIPASEMAGYGMTPDKFRALAMISSERVARMEAMAQLHGVDAARLDADRDVQIAVAVECLHCQEGRRCRETLARGAGPQEAGFCPNHDTWTALAER